MHQRYHLKLAPVALLAALALNGCTSPTGEAPRFPKVTDLTSAVTDVFRSKPRSQVAPTAEALYKDGIDYFERGRYARSISFFQRLRDEYPFSKEAADAELKIAEAYYRNEEYSLAEETYKNYLTFQPTGQNAHDVKYQLGRVNLEQFTGVDRDLEKVREAKRHFESVIRDHPDSEHVPDARKRLAEIRVHLAERELYVGDYYLRDERFEGARERFEKVLQDYPDTPAAAEARGRLAKLPETGPEAPGTPSTSGDAGAASAEKSSEPTRFITKEGYEYEDPTQRSWYSYLNPFSWRRGNQEPADSGPQEPAGGAEQQASTADVSPAGDAPPPEEEKKGFFSFLNPFSSSRDEPKPDEPKPPAKAGAAEAATATAVVKSVDETLGTRGASRDDAPKPPVASLPPEEKEPGPEPSDPAEVLGDIDKQLGESAASGDAPQAPAADPALFSAAKPRSAKQESASDKPRSGLLEGIDRQLGREGIDTSGELPPPPAAPNL